MCGPDVVVCALQLHRAMKGIFMRIRTAMALVGWGKHF